MRAPGPVLGVDQAGSPQESDQAVRLILDSGVFDVEWYQVQANLTFLDPAEAVQHYLVHGRRSGWSPHPLFLPVRFRPLRWKRDGVDPLVTYLEGGGRGWRAVTSPLFDPVRLDQSGDTGRSPLAGFLADGVARPLPLAADAGWLRDGVTLDDVGESLRSELSELDGGGTGLWPGRPAAIMSGLTSVVIVDSDTTTDVFSVLAAAHRAARAGDDGPKSPIELILLVAGGRRQVMVATVLSRLARYPVRILPVAAGQGVSAAVNEAVHCARGDRVLLMSAHQVLREGTLHDWRASFDDSGAAVVHPVVLRDDLLLRDAGAAYPPQGKDPVPFLGGVHPDSVPWPRSWFPVPGAPLPLFARTKSLRAVGDADGPRALWADIDLSQRLAVHEGRPVVVARDLVAMSSGPGVFDDTSEPEDDLAAFRTAWARVPSGSADLFRAFGVAPVFTGLSALTVPGRPRAWTRALWLRAPADAATVSGATGPSPGGADGLLQVHESPPALRWAIKTAMPADDRARQWGDFHFAHSLAGALRGLGQQVVVDHGPHDGRETSYRDDVVLLLRGLRPARLPADVTSVVWVISHPEDVTARELVEYDLRYAASLTWSQDVSSRWGVPVRPLLQCTDPSRFYVDDEPVEEVTGKAVLVGNTRGKARPVAVEAARSGTPVAVYGSGWDRFLPAEFIAGTYVPNEIVRRYYRSAVWALNDHWPDMRDLGFVSNRVFDVLASGGRLLTDDVQGLDEVFRPVLPDGGLVRFTTPEGLHGLLRQGSAAWYDEATLCALSEYVRSEHGFEARAALLLQDVLAHRAEKLSRA